MSVRLLLALLVSVTIIFCGVGEYRTLARQIKVVRSIKDLAGMITAATCRKATFFLPYGNWCGYHGGGKVLDAVDNCCKLHDLCYNKTREERICRSNLALYGSNYNWKIEGNDIICSTPEDGNKCDLSVCRCDRDIALCLAKSMGSYDEAHKFP